MKTANLVVSSLAALALVACSGSNSSSSGSSGTSATNAGSGSTTTNGAGSTGSASTGTTGAASTGSSSGSSGSASTNGSSSGSTTTSSGSSGSGNSSGSSGSNGSSGSTGNTTPITAPDLTWTWVDFPNAHCRDGSATGIGVNLNPNSDKVLVFLMGGGACFNSITCNGNPSSFGATDFNSQIGSAQLDGVFDRSNPANPFADWSMVFVPYCTGDVHAGNNPAGSVSGVSGTQQFVGYTDMQQYLARLVPTFPNATQIVFSGASAGGFGAAANYTQAARAFSPIHVDMLDDSGPLMEDPYLASCLQDQIRQLWGLDSTILADCGADCPDNTNYLLPYLKHVVNASPTSQFGLMDSTDDNTITLFFGFGANNCTGFGALDEATFTAGLEDIRTQMASSPNWGEFIFGGTQHTAMGDADFYTLQAPDGGVVMSDWVAQLADGGVSNTGP